MCILITGPIPPQSAPSRSSPSRVSSPPYREPTCAEINSARPLDFRATMAGRGRRKIAIIGAAIAGPTFALQILSHPVLRARFHPILFDQSPPPRSLASVFPKYVASGPLARQGHRSGASVGIFANGLYPLYKLGLKDALRQKGIELADLSIWYCGLDGTREKLQRQMNPTWSEKLGTGTMFYEWGDLREILLQRIVELGGEVEWGRELVGVEALGDGTVAVQFRDGQKELADLVVGADGGFSKVRRSMLEHKDPNTAQSVWTPDFQGTTGIYGISSAKDARWGDDVHPEDQHLIFVDNGYLATGPSPGGKVRWDLVLRESDPPAHLAEDAATEARLAAAAASTDDALERRWLSAMRPNQYSPSSTLEILHRFKDVFHPAMGSLESIFNNAERIIRGPLRQRVWTEDEIQHGNVVLIGDASRLLLPTSGQGKTGPRPATPSEMYHPTDLPHN